MIIKASQRGSGRELANHLWNLEDNQHVELHSLRGFVSDDLHGALLETEAVSKFTKCKQPFLSISFNPPYNEEASNAVFETALAKVESEFGLEQQGRATVFHEKDGRRHMHAVYSRIDVEEMKAINLSFHKRRINEISREMFIENEWRLPNGYLNSQEANPANYTHAQYQQARRAGRDPKQIKKSFQEAWNISDGVKAFSSALEERGLYLSKGDRRGYVAVDHKGEIYSVARWIGIRTKAVREKLGDQNSLPSILESKSKIAEKLTPVLKQYIRQCNSDFQVKFEKLKAKRKELTNTQRFEREKMLAIQKKREAQENRERSERLRKGLRGIWDRLTGKYKKTKEQNEIEYAKCKKRDEEKMQNLICRQLKEQQQFQSFIFAARVNLTKEITHISRDIYQLKHSIVNQIQEDEEEKIAQYHY